MREVIEMDPLKNQRPRRKCGKCKYRLSDTKRSCGYMYFTGKRRGCSPEECDVYEKGPRLKKPNVPAWSVASDYEY